MTQIHSSISHDIFNLSILQIEVELGLLEIGQESAFSIVHFLKFGYHTMGTLLKLGFQSNLYQFKFTYPYQTSDHPFKFCQNSMSGLQCLFNFKLTVLERTYYPCTDKTQYTEHGGEKEKGKTKEKRDKLSSCWKRRETSSLPVHSRCLLLIG